MATPVETTPARAKAKSRDRSALEHLSKSASTLLVIAIVAMVNYLAFRHYQRFDWTSQGLFTLSPKSKTVLLALNHDLDLYVFLSRGESSFAQTDELIKRYVAATPHLKVHYVDPDRDASQFKLLGQRFGIAAAVLETGEARADVAAVVAMGDKNWHVSREALMTSDMPAPMGDSSGGDELQMKAEQALTGAIVQVTSGRATKLCATQGHGEWSLDESAERSFAGLQRALHHDNIEWEAFDSLGQKSVPKTCDAMLVAGPLRAFSEPEAKLLIDYVRGGGNLLLALDPVLEHDQVNSTGFENALRDVGIRLDSALVLELNPEHLLTRNAAEFLVTEFGDHATTRPFQHAARVFMSLVRSITPISKDGGIDILMRTSDKGFGKTAIAEIGSDAEPKPGPGDIAGPVTIAVATQLNKANGADPKPGGRLIVVGDSDFMQGALLEAPELANFHLVSAFIGWLAERPALIEIPPKKIKSGNIVFSQDDLWSVFFRVAVLVPAAALILGVAVWLNRRA